MVYLVDRAFPGIWPLFMWAAERGLRQATAVPSWFRTPDENARVGGHPDSQHLVALAFDAVGPDLSQLAADLSRAGFRVVRYSDHIHAQVLAAGQARATGLLDAVGA